MDAIERQPTERPALYSEEDVREILDRALALQGRDFTHDHLAEMAQELGISPAQLELAERQWLAESADQRERAAFVAQRQGEARQRLGAVGLAITLAAFAYLSRLFILPALAVIAFFPLFLVALATLYQLYHAYLENEGEGFDKEFNKWLRRREKRRRRALKHHRAGS